MLFFGHVGITIGVVHTINVKFGLRVDLRKVAVLAVLPDLIDKPLGILYPNLYGNHTRLYGHSLMAVVSFFLLSLLLRGRTYYPKMLTLAYGGHLLLDKVWEKNVNYFLWPVMNAPQQIDTTAFQRWSYVLYNPYLMAGEVIGLTFLIALTIQYSLFRKEVLKAFLRSGVLAELPKDRANWRRRERDIHASGPNSFMG